jgi:hypothetical protein
LRALVLFDTSLRVSQVLSICIVAVCSIILVAMLIKVKKHPVKIEGVDYFPPDAAKMRSEIKAEKLKAQSNIKTVELGNEKGEGDNG